MTKTYRLKIEQDSDPMNPRTEWDNVATMVCWHSRYSLGDKHDYDTPERAIKLLLHEYDKTTEEELDEWYEAEYDRRNIASGSKSHDELIAEYQGKLWAAFEQHYVSRPLYLYDHSGITISTGRFSCPWDTSRVGFIYLAKVKAKQEYGHPEFKAEGWTEAMHKKTVEMLENEVETYDQYLTGEVYGFVLESHEWPFEIPDQEVDIEDDDLTWEDEESCWGFFGDDVHQSGIMDHLSQLDPKDVEDAMNNPGDWVEVKLKESEVPCGC